MKKTINILIIIIFTYCRLYAQSDSTLDTEGNNGKDNQKSEKNITKDYTAEYWLFGSVPVLVIAWGIGTWGWGTAAKWHFEGDGWGLEQDSYTGGADKLGHTWGVYMLSRVGSYAFEKSGDSRIRAALKGFVFGQFVGLGIEVGDGFGDTYGFAWGDTIWNLGGGIIALLLDIYPTLDDLIGFQMEYWPSKDHRDQSSEKWIEFTSDVSGQKFILALKLSGIPYIKNTLLQYFQIDFGYYTKGYWYNPSNYTYESRHTYIGFTFNLSRLSDKLLPESSLQFAASSFFKYFHPPIAYNPETLDNTLAGKTLITPK